MVILRTAPKLLSTLKQSVSFSPRSICIVKQCSAILTHYAYARNVNLLVRFCSVLEVQLGKLKMYTQV